jgi:hypothetical protein
MSQVTKAGQSFIIVAPGCNVDREAFIDNADGKMYVEEIHNSQFITIGIVLAPRNDREMFVYNFCHGILMRYSLMGVLEYCIRDYLNNWSGWTGRK